MADHSEQPAGLPLLSPASFNRSLSAVQQISVSRDAAETKTFRAILNISPTRVEVAALGPFNRPILSLNWDGNALEADALPQLVNAGVSPRRLLNDIQLVMWPCAAWEGKFETDTQWTCDEEYRQLSHQNVPVVSVRTKQPGHWKLNHHRDGYQLDILSRQ
jgi:hypothetical protein